jgi:hypothetical protein
MIDHAWTAVCLFSSIDIESNRVSLHEVLEQITVLAAPDPDLTVAIGYDVVSLWMRSNPDIPIRGDCQIGIVSPSGTVMHTFHIDIDLETHERSRTRLHVGGFPATEPGRHLIVAAVREDGEAEWREVARIPVRLVFEPPAEASEAEQPAPESLTVN